MSRVIAANATLAILQPMIRDCSAKDRLDRSGQDNATDPIPLHLHRSSITFDLDGVVQKTTPNPSDNRATRTRTRSERDTATSLPNAQADMTAVDNLDEVHVRLMAEQSSGFNLCSHSRHVDGCQIIDEERAMRIAHATGSGTAGKRQGIRVDRLGKRDILPIEKRFSHIDRHALI